MWRHHLIRVGVLGQVGRFTSVDAVGYPRGTRVVVRSRRGLELGEVLAADEAPLHGQSDGGILRAMTTEDRLLEARLEKNRLAAFAACEQRIRELDLKATLVDVEHLFDGRSLYFHFLGPTPPELEAFTAELAEAYDCATKFRNFAETLAAGCGPDCGTHEAGGHGCATCATGCAVSCAVKR